MKSERKLNAQDLLSTESEILKRVATEVIEKLKLAVETINKGNSIADELVIRVSEWHKPITGIQD